MQKLTKEEIIRTTVHHLAHKVTDVEDYRKVAEELGFNVDSIPWIHQIDDIILDLLGVPADNTTLIDYNNDEHVPEDIFCRDYHPDKLWEIIENTDTDALNVFINVTLAEYSHG